MQPKHPSGQIEPGKLHDVDDVCIDKDGYTRGIYRDVNVRGSYYVSCRETAVELRFTAGGASLRQALEDYFTSLK